MRIGIFSESYEPIINGVSVCVSILRDELGKRGHEVFVFAPYYKEHIDNCNNVFRFPSKHTVFMPDYPFPVPYAPKLWEVFCSLNLDIVHTQTPFLLGVTGAKWARRCGVPLVSTNHTLYTEYAHYAPIRPKALTRYLLIRLMRWYYSGCDAVVVPSRPVEAMLRSYGVKTPIDVIKTGVELIEPLETQQCLEVRQKLTSNPDEFVILYVGRIAREKNLGMLLNAFKLILKSHDNIRLVMVGAGPALSETKHMAEELGVASKITFTGMLKREATRDMYCAADLFVFPSTTETQGLAICEALSAGLPVVAVNAGGIPENIQPGMDGLLTDNDPVQFAEQISILINDPSRRAQMGKHARQNAQNFSVERMAENFERLYEQVIESAGSPGLLATKRTPQYP